MAAKPLIVIAGGAGFIGSHLCDYLIEQKCRLLVLDNLITGRRANIEHLQSHPDFRFEELDIEDSCRVTEICREPIHQIYNLASPASPVDFAKYPLRILMTSALGHKNLLELAKKNRARILFASTSEVYGDPLVHPQAESYFGNVNPIGERSCYDEAKRFGETLSMVYHRSEGIEVRLARIFNTYGPRMRLDDGRIIPNFFVQALKSEALTVYGDGSQTRSFCYVSDLVSGLYLLMQSQEVGPVNLGADSEMTVLEMANRINQLTGNKTPHCYRSLPGDDPKQRRPDTTRAWNALRWKPQVPLEEGLARASEYFRVELGLSLRGPA